MKALFTLIILFIYQSSSIAGESGLTWNLKGTPPGGSTYQFDVRMGEKDRWDSATQPTPPLEPGKAIQLATQFLKKVPLEGDWKSWRLDQVQMLCSFDAEGHEEWVYVVHFFATIPGKLTSGAPDMNVPVRMDGTIPEPVITKPKI